MKRIIIFQLLGIMLVGLTGPTAFGQLSRVIGGSGATATLPATTTGVQYDVLHLRADGNAAYKAARATALSRGQLLRQVCAMAQPGDTLVLAPTDFDLDGKNRGTLIIPDDITMTSHGKARLVSNVFSDDQGAAFEIKNDVFTNISFANYTWKPNEDGQTIKFFTGSKRTPGGALLVLDEKHQEIIETPPATYSALFRNCDFIGNAWTVYDWSGKANHWRFEDCTFVSGRQALSMMSNSGAQVCEAMRCIFDIDAARSADVGWTSNVKVGGVYAAVVRSGTMRLIDCEFHLRGRTSTAPSYTPRCVGVYDGNGFGSVSSDQSKIEVLNARFYVDGNGATDVYDFFITQPGIRQNLRLSGGWGSGPNGAFTKNW